VDWVEVAVVVTVVTAHPLKSPATASSTIPLRRSTISGQVDAFNTSSAPNVQSMDRGVTSRNRNRCHSANARFNNASDPPHERLCDAIMSVESCTKRPGDAPQSSDTVLSPCSCTAAVGAAM
jgi:hypothetical protein